MVSLTVSPTRTRSIISSESCPHPPKLTLTIRWWSKTAHSYGMAIGLKNAGNLLAKGTVAQPYQQDLVAAFDFNVIEACVSLFDTVSECTLMR